MKKTILFLLVIVFALASIGCSIGGNNVIGSEEGPYGKYHREVKFTTIRHSNPNPNAPAGMTMVDNPYSETLKDKLNVTYEILWTAENYNEKLSMDIISGTIPDIFYVDDYLMYKQLVQNDLLEDLTDVYENYANENTKSIYDTYGDVIFEPVTEDDRLMALPGTNNGYQQSMLWVRKDWLDMLGLEPPKTVDDIISVARAFIEQDPGGNGIGNTVGININREHIFDGYRNSFGLEPIAAAYGVYPKTLMLNDEGELYYGSLTPEYKTVLGKVREMVQSGIIDINSFEQGWETIWGNVIEGRTGLFFFPWSYPYGHQQFIENNPRGELIAYPAPLDGNGEFTYVSCAPTENFLCVRKGYEYPEILFKVINVCFDMRNGVDEEGAEKLQPLYDAGTDWTYLIPTGRFNLTRNDSVPLTGARIKDYVDNGVLPDEHLTDQELLMYEQAKNWAENKDNPINWVTYTSRYMASNQTDLPECKPIVPAFYYKTESMLDVWDYLQSTENAMVYEILTGNEPLDYFDQFVQDWRDAGGDDILDEVRELIGVN